MFNFLLNILAVVLLSVIFLQDLRQRAVSILLFIFLFGCLIGWEFIEYPYMLVLESWGMNLVFLLLLMSLLSVYMLLTRRSAVLIGVGLGMGDVIFWVISAVVFSLPNFICFLIGSLVFSLVLHLIFRIVKVNWYTSTVPLAGYQAFLLLFLLIVRQLYPAIDYHSDILLLSQLR